MRGWQEDLLSVSVDAKEPADIFRVVESAAKALEFDNCSYGIRFPVPCARPEVIIFSNYPEAWAERYIQNGYPETDPVVLHGMRSQSPLLWSKAAFASAPRLWDEAQSFGLRFGWSQSSFDCMGVGGLLSLSRPSGEIAERELEHKEMQMRWLTHVAHLCFCRALNPRHFLEMPALTRRETEVLKWTADGKSSLEIAGILGISKCTVDFHVKNAVIKLKVANKTAAAVRAAMLGLLCAY